jgi:hypothetical protein
MERPFGGARLDWRPLIPLHASHPSRRLPLFCRFLCRTRFCSALLATFLGTPEYGSQFLEILRRQVRGQTLGHHDCVTAHFDAFGCNGAGCSLGRWTGRALCGFSYPDLVRWARRCKFIDTCWFHWRVGRNGIGHGAPRWRKDSWIALPNNSRGAGRCAVGTRAALARRTYVRRPGAAGHRGACGHAGSRGRPGFRRRHWRARPQIREDICRGLSCIGLELDEQLNRLATPDVIVSAATSRRAIRSRRGKI